MKKKRSTERIVIIGAGPAGLGAAWRLVERGYTDFVIYEKQPYVGGLATSYIDDAGFTWDIGGHVLHSHYPYFDAMFETVMEGEYLTHERESWVFMNERFIPYPFQNNIHRLPLEIRDACLIGLKQRQGSKNVRTFAEWIRKTYGAGIAAHFMVPYNEKVWAHPIEDMSVQWVGDRVAPVDIARIEENIQLSRDDVSWGPNAVFHYPKHGGTGDIWNRVSHRFSQNIQHNKNVVSIDAKKHQIRFSDGTHDTYDRLFTTMPLTRLGEVVEGVQMPGDVTTLVHNAVTIVGIGVQGVVPDTLRTKCWMYFPEADVPFFRATVLSNYSPNNAPTGMWSLMTEITSSGHRPLPSGDLISQVVERVRTIGLVPASMPITHTWMVSSAYGYPVPTLGRDAVVDPVLEALEAHDIYSRGRFGMWKYEVSNQDHTFMQGVEWVDAIGVA